MGQKEAIFMLENNNAVLAVVDPVYPGTALRPGSSGSEVARMQTYLNGLRDAKYPTLNRLVVDGRYGSATASTVMQYQVINRLSMDGVIGHDTWNAIVSDYNATIGGSADTYPGIPLRPGDRSQDVRHMQGRLNEVARIYTGINTQTVDGAYGNNMTNASSASSAFPPTAFWARIPGTRSSPCITPCRRATPRTLPLSIPAYRCA